MSATNKTLGKGDALILVDVQNDFLPGGSLAVAGGDQIIPTLNFYIDLFQNNNLPIIATRDWHPDNHCSFKNYGGIWPPHCVAGTTGAEFSSQLNLPARLLIFSKATTSESEAYSGLDGTNLDKQLKRINIHQVWIGGLTTDYCVLQTVKDLLALGYKVNLLVDAIRAVNVSPDDGINAEEK